MANGPKTNETYEPNKADKPNETYSRQGAGLWVRLARQPHRLIFSPSTCCQGWSLPRLLLPGQPGCTGGVPRRNHLSAGRRQHGR